uniref:Uncharacterized protein n=1 Tax=Oryza rufipogon TaxID=4529 RepID=A0A0E0NRE4_ORYRU
MDTSLIRRTPNPAIQLLLGRLTRSHSSHAAAAAAAAVAVIRGSGTTPIRITPRLLHRVRAHQLRLDRARRSRGQHLRCPWAPGLGLPAAGRPHRPQQLRVQHYSSASATSQQAQQHQPIATEQFSLHSLHFAIVNI